MRKEIFLLGEMSQEKVKQALGLGVEGLFVGHKNLKEDFCQRLKREKEGIRIYVEVGIFAGEEWWQKYPDSRPITRDGKQMKKIKWYAGVCPNHPGVRRERLKEIEGLIAGIPINGIWLDFIRYPGHWEVRRPDLTEYCFCQNCLNGFRKAVKTPRGWPNGLPGDGGKVEEFWIRWKCDQITSFVAEVRGLIDQSGKDIQLGMFSVPWQESDFDGAITKVIGQDFKSLAQYIDVFSPMVYHQMCGRRPEWIHEVVAYMDEITGKPVLPIIQTEDKPGKILKEEFIRALNLSLAAPSSGVIVFFLEDLLKDKDKLEVVRNRFRTQ